MNGISIKFYRSALAAVRAAEILHRQGLAAAVTPKFGLVIKADAATGQATDALQLFSPGQYDFPYGGPRPRVGMACNVVDPAHSRLLAALLDQAAILAEMGSVWVDGRPAGPLFAAVADQLRQQTARDHGATDDEAEAAVDIP